MERLGVEDISKLPALHSKEEAILRKGFNRGDIVVLITYGGHCIVLLKEACYGSPTPCTGISKFSQEQRVDFALVRLMTMVGMRTMI